MSAVAPLFGVVAELTAVVGLLAAVVSLVAKIHEMRKKADERESARLDRQRAEEEHRAYRPPPAPSNTGVSALIYAGMLGGAFLMCGGCLSTLIGGCKVTPYPTAKDSPPEKDGKGKAEPSPTPRSATGDAKGGKAAVTPVPDQPTELVTTVEANGVRYELVEWGWSGKQLFFWLTAKNLKADRALRLSGNTVLVDEQGDTQRVTTRICGRATNSDFTWLEVPVPFDTSVRFGLRFDHVTPSVKNAQVLTVHIDGQQLQFRNIPLGQLAAPAPPPKSDPPAAAKGTLVVQTKQKLAAGVVAFIEVDGKRAADWTADKTEVRVEVAAGEHTVVLRSKFKGSYFKIELGRVEVADGEKKVVPVPDGPPKPDKDGKW